MNRSFRLRFGLAISIILIGGAIYAADSSTKPTVPEAARGAAGLDSALKKLHAPDRNTAPLSPRDSLATFHPAAGLAVDLIASEPEIRQPLCINFDARGRMWVTQYIQYPFPAGLKVVEYDNFLRAKFDKVPEPPPRRERGNDRITILEDVKGDGSYSKATTFLDGLNIATSALPDKDGVWVLNPPYLLFYSDKNHRDIPDGDPVVHLSGFGLQDTHSVTSNLTWGPDGWIYAAHGSTVISSVKVVITGETKTTDFLGQAIWRYHPVKHIFEIFAEGGGNTFGVAFDSKGRLFSGTNFSNYRGMHYVQGAYGEKSWGKHGPLTNPYAFGYFPHMAHTGNVQRLTHTFTIYDGGLLPELYNGKLIGPNPLQSRLQVTRLEPIGSTYSTVEEPFMMTSDDGWFRPVDIKTGPDGAIYVADFYEHRITHLDPRDTWDRSNGRIYRVRPEDCKPGMAPFDLTKPLSEKSSKYDQLLKLFQNKNGWFRAAARRAIADRNDPSVVPELKALFKQENAQVALESFLTLNLMNSVDHLTMLDALNYRDAFVRMWAIRLIGDSAAANRRSIEFDSKLIELAETETDPQVRSQLASTAKRLPGLATLGILYPMLRRDEDAADPHIPLLLWWALEDKAVSQRDAVMGMFMSSELCEKKIVRETILRRLARRWAAEPTPENQIALYTLLRCGLGEAERKMLFTGIAEAFEGREIRGLLPGLAEELAHSGNVELMLRGGDPNTQVEVLRVVASEDDKLKKDRLKYIDLLGQLARPESIEVFLRVAEITHTDAIRRAVVASLVKFDDPALGGKMVSLYAKIQDPVSRSSIVGGLVTRSAWARSLMAAVESGAIQKSDIPPDRVNRLRQIDDAAFLAQVEQLFGKAQKPTSEEKAKEIETLSKLVDHRSGDATAGKLIFTARCAACHTLFNEGGHVGPDLTGYDRRNLEFLALSIVDPSASIREEFTSFRVKTTDGRTLEGLIVERSESQITLLDSASQKTTLPRSQFKEEKALAVSLMPEGLLAGLSEKELRDLFAYLMK